MRKVVVLLIGFLFFSGIAATAWAEPPWAVEVRTGKAGVSLDALCEKLSQSSPYRMEKPDTYSREIGLSLAKNLLDVFSAPRQARAKAGSCLDGKLRFDNGGAVMEALIRVLDRTGAQPQDIGKTSAELRRILLKDFASAIARLRQVIKGSEDGYWSIIRTIAYEAIEQWNFTPEELGLTPEDLVTLRKKG